MNTARVDQGGVPSSLEAAQSLETPCYVFDPAIVIEDYTRLKTALNTPLVVSLKANPNIDLFVRCAHVFSDGVELASLGELNLVAGRAGAQKYVNSPVLDASLIQATMASRDAMLILDSPEQAERAIANKKAGRALRVGLRLNAASLLGDAMKPVHADHFGVDLDTLCRMAARLAEQEIEVAGVHVFAGSASFENYGTAIARNAATILDALAANTGKPLEFLNLGGGFCADWDDSTAYFREYRDLVARLRARTNVLHEAGRAVFQRCGAFFTTVQNVKRMGNRFVAACDGGIAQAFLLAQTESVLRRPRRPKLLPAEAEGRATLDRPVQVVGSSCNRGDIIGDLDNGVVPRAGDILRFADCGAYHTYSPVGFLNLKRANVYIVS